MKNAKENFTISIILILLLSLAGPSINASARPLLATSPTLGAVASYSVLAGTTVTNSGPTTLPGDLGVSPGTAVVGFPPGIVGPPGSIHAGDAAAADAQIATTAAFAFLDQSCDTTYTGVQDMSLVSPLGPGTYCADAFILTGNLTLSGSGVWIFKSAATLTTSDNSSVTGGDPCNVWWRLVSSATLGPNTSFIGNILASASIALQTGASLDGRALAQTGGVTLDSSNITGSSCLAPPLPTATSAAPTATSTSPAPTDTATLTETSTGPAPTGTDTPMGPIATATDTPVAPIATATDTQVVPKPTATHLPVPTALPGTGGAPIRNEGIPWSLVIVIGFSAAILFFAIRGSRRSNLPKQ